jgi:hypothetical protein
MVLRAVSTTMSGRMCRMIAEETLSVSSSQGPAIQRAALESVATVAATATPPTDA